MVDLSARILILKTPTTNQPNKAEQEEHVLLLARCTTVQY